MPPKLEFGITITESDRLQQIGLIPIHEIFHSSQRPMIITEGVIKVGEEIPKKFLIEELPCVFKIDRTFGSTIAIWRANYSFNELSSVHKESALDYLVQRFCMYESLLELSKSGNMYVQTAYEQDQMAFESLLTKYF